MESLRTRVTGIASNGNIVYWFYLVSPVGERLLIGEAEYASLNEAMNFARRAAYESCLRVDVVEFDSNAVVGTAHYS